MKSVVYFLQRADGDIKIGTTTDYAVRLAQLEHLHGEFRLLGLMEGARAEERRLHNQFAYCRRARTEFFEPHQNLLQFIQSETSLHIERPRKRVSLIAGISSKTLAAIDMIVGEMRAATGERVTQDKAIWAAIEKAVPQIAARVEELQMEEGSKKEKKRAVG